MSSIERIVWEDRLFEFNNPLPFALNFEDGLGLWVIKCEELGILIFDEDLECAYDQFREGFVFLWDEYVEESDSILTEDARELKQKIRRLVREVKPAVKRSKKNENISRDE